MKRRTLLGWAALTGALTVSRHALTSLPDPESRSDASTAQPGETYGDVEYKGVMTLNG